jgi:IS5 family transposase
MVVTGSRCEVSDSIAWRRFCRIDIDGRVPYPTTLMKLTTRCGEQAIAALNDELIGNAVEHRLVKNHDHRTRRRQRLKRSPSTRSATSPQPPRHVTHPPKHYYSGRSS